MNTSTAARTYLSKRGRPLLYVGEPSKRPILTLENYTKWYELYLVMPNGDVREAELDDVQYVMDKYADARWVDHLYHPRLLYRLAERIDAVVDERAIEVTLGRWMLESGNCDQHVSELKFTCPEDTP